MHEFVILMYKHFMEICQNVEKKMYDVYILEVDEWDNEYACFKCTIYVKINSVVNKSVVKKKKVFVRFSCKLTRFLPSFYLQDSYDLSNFHT